MIILVWCALALSARCSGSNEIQLDRAEQISTYGSYTASNAIDNNLATTAMTTRSNPSWLKVYFTSVSNVEKVVIEKGYTAADCTFTVSVNNGGQSVSCGTYTKSKGSYDNESVQCGGKTGDSVKVEKTNCEKSLRIAEIAVYSAGKTD